MSPLFVVYHAQACFRLYLDVSTLRFGDIGAALLRFSRDLDRKNANWAREGTLSDFGGLLRIRIEAVFPGTAAL